MAAITVQLPDSLRKRLWVLAEQEGVSINSLISTAVSEKISALDAETLLLERAKRGSTLALADLLTRVPDAALLSGDDLP